MVQQSSPLPAIYENRGQNTTIGNTFIASLDLDYQTKNIEVGNNKKRDEKKKKQQVSLTGLQLECRASHKNTTMTVVFIEMWQQCTQKGTGL